MSILVYGATGYTGKLIARMAGQLGMSVTLAGRNEAKLQAIGKLKEKYGKEIEFTVKRINLLEILFG